jgi:FkbM family methyltransferase
MHQPRLLNSVIRKISAGFRYAFWEILKHFRSSVTVRTKQGLFTVMLSDKVISRALYGSGEFELELFVQTLGILRSRARIPPFGKGTILDIGANNGVISIGALYRGEMEKAVAIEPDQVNFQLLMQNTALNGLSDRMVCLPYAVSDSKGQLTLELSERNFGDHRIRNTKLNRPDIPERNNESKRSVVMVPSDTLTGLMTNVPDEYKKTLAVIWIDVQGHEGFVFRGAPNFFRQDIPVVSEISPYGIARSGMTGEEFCTILQGIWSECYVRQRGKFIRIPIQNFREFYNALGESTGNFTNVILLH